MSTIDFEEQILPPTPSDEIPRDALVRQITAGFGPDRQGQMVVGGIQTGKTNLLAQFVRHHKGRCISYFISASPLTQRQHAFLYAMCYQMSLTLEAQPPPEIISLEDLKSLFSSLSLCLARQAKKRDTLYYFVVDGLDQGLDGPEGDRIVDLFPLQTSPHSPYLLFSCRLDRADSLPDFVRCHRIELTEFGRPETAAYLDELGLSPDEIDHLQRKCHGVPGYLKIIKAAKRANPDFNLETAPVELSRLIDQQVATAMKTSEQPVIRALETLAVSPKPLPLEVLAELTQIDEPTLLGALQRTGLVRCDPRDRLEYSNELVRENVRARVGDRIGEVAKELLDYIRENRPDEEFVLELLLRDTQDYEGLRGLLTESAIASTIDSTHDISNVIRRMLLASEMARQSRKTDDMIRWTSGIAAARSFMSHVASSNEIEALLSIGNSQEALSKAYAIPELHVRISMLAKAYASMKEGGERVPKSALDELAALVESLDLEDLDREMAQQLAMDLLPVLPDVAVSLLEKIIEESERRSIVEIAIEALEGSSEREKPPISKKREELGYIAQLLSAWLNNLPLSRLLKELEPVENTKAREYILRQWCRQNAESAEVTSAINLWLDTVVGDRDFVPLLRSLRHISEVVIKVPVAERARLIGRLQVPGFTALDSPKEEWVRFRLNLAEGLLEVNEQSARRESEDVHKTVLKSVLDLDVRTFCLARLWGTIGRLFPDDCTWISEVEAQFDESFRLLLNDSAEQLEPLVGTIRALVEVDPVCALTAASELNTYERRTGAIGAILETTLRKHGDQELVGFVKDALELLDGMQRSYILEEIISELSAREAKLTISNLKTLLKYSQEIADPFLRARTLSNLASLFHNTSPSDAAAIMEQAVEAWRTEDDLKVRLSLGFEIVRDMARLNLDRAKELYAEVQDLKLQPGSQLAIGQLGAVFKESLDIAIRTVVFSDLVEAGGAIQCLESFILRIPSRVIQVELFAKLAARAYQVGNRPYADGLVRDKVIPVIEQMESEPEQLDRNIALQISLPVILEYDFSIAKGLADKLPYPVRDEAWYSAVLWSLCRSYLGDHQFEPDELRVKNDYPRLQKVVRATGEIDYDVLLCQAIKAITSSIKASFDSMLDLKQALDILQGLDDLASSKLPEQTGRNIKHEGYRVLSEAHIHGARSFVYHKTSKKRGLSSKYMGERWQDICNRAKSINNTADRVFVMALIAPEMVQYYQDRHYARALLEEAESQVVNIPTLVDRVDRLQVIADSWHLLREKTRAEFMLEKAFELANQLESATADERLGMLVQVACQTVSSAFADALASRLDRKLPGEAMRLTDLVLWVEKLRGNPSTIDQLPTPYHTRGAVMSRAARKLLRDLAAGRGTVARTDILENWLMEARLHHPRVSIDVTHWIIENLCRKGSGTTQSRLGIFLSTAQLASELARWISIVKGEGIPEPIYDSFPGLNTRVETFRAGEADRAKRWVQQWLSDHVECYLKICDPYFGPEELEYLMYIPIDCRVLIATTDRYLHVGDDPERVKHDLEMQWKSLTSQMCPNVQILIVPRELEERFHDRAIITLNAGLDIGQSLNGLGKSHGKITVLSEEDARQLETTYVDKILNNAAWFLQGIRPTILCLGA